MQTSTIKPIATESINQRIDAMFIYYLSSVFTSIFLAALVNEASVYLTTTFVSEDDQGLRKIEIGIIQAWNETNDMYDNKERKIVSDIGQWKQWIHLSSR